MKCPYCGESVSDHAKFCPKCGKGLETAGQRPKKKTDKKKHTHSRLLVVFLTVLILLAAAVAGALGVRAYMNRKAPVSSGSGWGDADGNHEADEDVEAMGDETESDELEAVTLAEADRETAPATSAPGDTAAGTTAAWGTNTIAGTTAAWGTNAAGTTAAWGTDTAETTAAWSNNPPASAAAQPYTAYSGEHGYILPDSSSRYLADSDIAGLNADQLRLARNEIYARHGRKFQDQGLQEYFNSQPWYNGTIEPSDFNDTALLNDVERKNLELIKAREAMLKQGH